MMVRDGRRQVADLGPLPCARLGASLSGRPVAAGTSSVSWRVVAPDLGPWPDPEPEPSASRPTRSRAEYMRDWRESHRAQDRAIRARWRESHREAIREADRRRSAARRAAARDGAGA